MRLYIDVIIHQTNYFKMQSQTSIRITMDLYLNLRAATIPLRPEPDMYLVSATCYKM